MREHLGTARPYLPFPQEISAAREMIWPARRNKSALHTHHWRQWIWQGFFVRICLPPTHLELRRRPAPARSHPSPERTGRRVALLMAAPPLSTNAEMTISRSRINRSTSILATRLQYRVAQHRCCNADQEHFTQRELASRVTRAMPHGSASARDALRIPSVRAAQQKTGPRNSCSRHALHSPIRVA